jgi:hypothetical protein
MGRHVLGELDFQSLQRICTARASAEESAVCQRERQRVIVPHRVAKKIESIER